SATNGLAFSGVQAQGQSKNTPSRCPYRWTRRRAPLLSKLMLVKPGEATRIFSVTVSYLLLARQAWAVLNASMKLRSRLPVVAVHSGSAPIWPPHYQRMRFGCFEEHIRSNGTCPFST